MNIPCDDHPCEQLARPRLVWQPVREIETLRARHYHVEPCVLDAHSDPLQAVQTPVLLIFTPSSNRHAAEITLSLRGTLFVINVAKQKITSGKNSMPLPVKDGRVDFRLLSDHGVIEIFTDNGFKFGAFQLMPDTDAPTAPKLTATGGTAKIVSLDVHELKSVWPSKGKL